MILCEPYALGGCDGVQHFSRAVRTVKLLRRRQQRVILTVLGGGGIVTAEPSLAGACLAVDEIPKLGLGDL